MSHNNTIIKKNISQRGVIKYIFWFFIAILILSFLGFNIENFMNSDIVKNNLGYIWNTISTLWVNYGKDIFDYFANLIGPLIHNGLNDISSLNTGGNNSTTQLLTTILPKIPGQ